MEPTIIRGHLAVPDRGTGRTFMFNPTEIKDNKGVNYGSLDLPGMSHPVLQYGSGGERVISFQLYLDGDRGKVARGGAANLDLSVEEDILFYRSLLYPVEFDVSGIRSIYPPNVLFSYGPLFKAVKCVVTKANVTVKYWTPQGEPVRATIDMELKEKIDKGQTAREIFPLETGR